MHSFSRSLVSGLIAAIGDQPIGVVAQMPSCELHIFPPHSVAVIDATQVKLEQGAVGNIIRDAVLGLFRTKDPKAVELFLQDALPAADQLAMVKAIDFQTTNKGRGKTIIVHDNPEKFTLNDYKTKPRLTASKSSCYTELVFSGTYFEKSTLHQSLKTSYFFRNFGSADVATRVVFKAAGAGIPNFPPKDEREAEAARNEVRRIASANILAALNAK